MNKIFAVSVGSSTDCCKMHWLNARLAGASCRLDVKVMAIAVLAMCGVQKHGGYLCELQNVCTDGRTSFSDPAEYSHYVQNVNRQRSIAFHEVLPSLRVGGHQEGK
jgi:hypothetical protein